MRGLTSAEVVALWESGQCEPAARRALTLLAPVCPGETWQTLARLSLGERDARLLELRERTFGSRLLSIGHCPACGETIEADFELSDLRAPRTKVEPLAEVQHREGSARFRLLDTFDLEAAADARDAGRARLTLIERCIIEPRDAAGQKLAARELPPELLDAVAAKIAAADPQSDVNLSLNCPACRQDWQAPFDIAGYFWVELQACARRLLREVHEIAAAYGWREADILALTPARRAAYLELVRG